MLRLTIVLITFLLIIFVPSRILAGPASDNFELESYGFGAGGTIDSTSGTYNLFGIAGDQAGDPASGSTYDASSGLTFSLQAAVPPAPAFTNPGSAYDRLKLVINTDGNPVDTQYAVAITKDSWVTTQYIQNDFTEGDALGAEDWLTYVQWNETSGEYITNLSSDTEYTVKVKARQGDFTETDWSTDVSESTSVPSLTFGVSTDTIAFDTLTGANSWTDSSKNTILTTSTNAYNGYTVFARETGPLTDGYGNTISDFSSPNAAPTAWAGIGFGYTTNDSVLTGGTADRFTTGGPKFAGFTTSTPGDPVADHSGPVLETPITDEEFTISYRVTADETAKAGDYINTILYIVIPEY